MIDFENHSFKKADLLKPMGKTLQKDLHFQIAAALYQEVLIGNLPTIEKDQNLSEAKEQILKALDLEFDNTGFKELLSKIKMLEG